MRVNRDASISRLNEKYGVKPVEGVKQWGKLSQPIKRKPKKSKKVKTPRLDRQPQTWLEIHRDYLRWRKTPEFQKWRKKQFLKQGGTCYYCDTPLGGVRENVEHITPKSAGGGNNKNNLVLACSTCNKEKNTKILSSTERAALKAKNKKKKGTYHILKEQYPSEYDLAMKLRDFC